MSLWIKICGLTTQEGVQAASEANVDAIGFVFAPSKRRVDVSTARELAAAAPGSIVRVAVMLHPSQAQLDEVVAGFAPDIVQTDAEDLRVLNIPAHIAVMPVFRSSQALPSILPQRLLFEGPVSGTGTTADWSQAAQVATRTQLVLAGGLSPLNVAQAVRTVRPFGVDVSSGVERVPGVKDAQKIFEFVHAARAAAESP